METRNEKGTVAFVSTHPGAVLGDWLEDVGIKQKDFAETIGLPESRLSELINGRRAMTEDIARRLEAALGMESSYWMRLQAAFEYNEKMLALRSEEQRISDSKENTLRAVFNLEELYRHLGVMAVSSPVRIAELLSRLGMTYEDMVSRSAIAGCFKHSDTLRIDEKNMRTWVLLAQYEAANRTVSCAYTAEKATDAAREIADRANTGTLREQEIEAILSDAGIAYAVVGKLPHCPVDAYSVMLSGRPAIVVTHRHNNMQKLVFDVLHEIGHIIMHMKGEHTDFISTDYSQNNPQESEANAYARDMLIPPDTWSKIIRQQISTVRDDMICRKIGQRAQELGIDPHIAVARYKHDSQRYRARVYSPTHIV